MLYVCRDESLKSTLKDVGRLILVKTVEWSDHVAHFKGPLEDLEDGGVMAADEPIDAEHPETGLESVPNFLSFRISGSGTQPVTKGILKCVLWTLAHPTFSLSQVQDTDQFTLIPPTKNQELGLPSGLLTPVYIGGAPQVPKQIGLKGLGFKITNRGKIDNSCCPAAVSPL